MTTNDTTTASRQPLSRERIFHAAIAVADEGGADALTMRRLGQALGVEAMSLYKHVANKDDILDGMIELVVAEIDLPEPGIDWKDAMRTRAVSMREMLSRHRWAISVMESRVNPGPVALHYYDWVIGRLLEAGFSIAMAAHAFAVIDSFIYGFAVQEQSLPFDTTQASAAGLDLAAEIANHIPPGAYPNLLRLITEHAMLPGYAFGNEFAYGLELVLDGLERRRDQG